MSKTKETKPTFSFPMNLIQPIGNFLAKQAKILERRIRRIEHDDPFEKIDRGSDKAAPDSDVKDRDRHESLSATKEQVERKLVQIRKAMSRIKIGKYGICESCGKMIDTDRLMIYPEATVCVECERKKEGRK